MTPPVPHEAIEACRVAAQQWENSPLERLVVTCRLAAPVAAGPTPWGRWQLDGLVCWALLDMLDLFPPWQPEPTAIFYPDLPFAKRFGVWAASELRPAGEVAWTSTRWRRRPAVDEAITYFAGRRLPRSGGAYRAKDEHLDVAVTTELVAVAVGVREWVQRLLDRVHYVGKKRSQGYGRILEWDVRVVDGDPDPWWALTDQDGRVTRAIPTRHAKRDPPRPLVGTVVHGGWRPPYWYRGDWREVLVP